jgi:hypothetical protein
MAKKMITVEIDTITYNLDGQTLDDAIKFLVEEKERYKDDYVSLRLDFDDVLYEDYKALYLKGNRLETDDEEKAREKKEAEDKTRRDSWERKQYEELKKKFETFQKKFEKEHN